MEGTYKQKIAFEKPKNILDETKLLVYYDHGKPQIFACDASPYRLGAVLSYQIPDGSEKPVTFASKTLSQTEKEALAIVKKFYPYLLDRPFYLYTHYKLSETKRTHLQLHR